MAQNELEKEFNNINNTKKEIQSLSYKILQLNNMTINCINLLQHKKMQLHTSEMNFKQKLMWKQVK